MDGHIILIYGQTIHIKLNISAKFIKNRSLKNKFHNINRDKISNINF
jgi:hypothetical protein